LTGNVRAYHDYDEYQHKLLDHVTLFPGYC